MPDSPPPAPDAVGPLVGLFGGTFDPVHNGHLETVTEVRSRAPLAEVRFLPAAQPPHRPPPRAAARDRLEMVTRAIAGRPGLVVDDRELRPGASARTFDTVRSLADGDRRLGLILGMDAFLGIESWHRWRELLERVHCIVMHRPGWSRPATVPDWWMRAETREPADLARQPAGRILIIDVRPVPVSATEIRRMIACGRDVGGLVPAPVRDYIRTRGLYRDGN